MSDPFLGEIRMFAGNFAPKGWALCDGSLMSISENDALFTLIGTTYGGDGQEKFALPDLRSRIPVHQGSGFVMGEKDGVEEVTLTAQHVPAHNHVLRATGSLATDFPPENKVLAASTAATTKPYGSDTPKVTLVSSTLAGAGGSQPHNNLQPFLCINFIISLFGIFPPHP